MRHQMASRWDKVHTAQMRLQRQAGFVTGALGVIARSLRMVIQSAVLALGAYLAIHGEMSSGSIIAASILSARALAPVDQVIGGWRGFVSARQAYGRLVSLLAAFPEPKSDFALPAPVRELSVEGVLVGPPGTQVVTVRNVSFKLAAGQALGIIGDSAAGKSSLVRALVGAWPVRGGKVRLDGASLDQWDQERLGPSIGYLPQDVQLLEGTIAENIARMDSNAPSAAIVAAATAAGLDQIVRNLPKGYETRVGLGGEQLSIGQRQRIGLARALYGDPFLVVLDEPTANLDAAGETALTSAIRSVRQRNGIAIVVSHRPSALDAVDMVLVMKDGQAVAFDEKMTVLRKVLANPDEVLKRARTGTNEAKVVPGPGLAVVPAAAPEPPAPAPARADGPPPLPTAPPPLPQTGSAVVSLDSRRTAARAETAPRPAREPARALPPTPAGRRLNLATALAASRGVFVPIGSRRWGIAVKAQEDSSGEFSLYEHEQLRNELTIEELGAGGRSIQSVVAVALVVAALQMVEVVVGATNPAASQLWWLAPAMALLCWATLWSSRERLERKSEYVAYLESQINGDGGEADEPPVGWEQYRRYARSGRHYAMSVAETAGWLTLFVALLGVALVKSRILPF
jgi:ABC-type multidrug transport system ATPase subunit